MTEADRTLKQKLLDLIARAHTHEQALVSRLTDAERNQVGTPERWAIKDILSHLAAWQSQASQMLAAIARGEKPAEVESIDEFNAQHFEAQRLGPWDNAWAEAEVAYAELVAQVQKATLEALTDPVRLTSRNNRPIWTIVLIDGYLHPVEHLSDIYLWRGDLAGATALQKEMAQTLATHFPGTTQHGNALYNLGCFFVKTGRPAEAIEAVRQSFPLNPALVEWSKKDTDLDSLRDNPAFQALYAK